MSFYDELKKDMRFVSPKRVADEAMLFPAFRAKVDAFIADATAQGYSLMLFETFRSTARQMELFRQGASKLKNVGVHNYGLAVDIVKSIHGEPSWKGDFTFFGPLARKHGLIWGGDWGSPDKPHSFVDPVHLQFITVADQKKLFAGTWYPDESYKVEV